MAPLPIDLRGGNGRGCARLCAGGTPALPGGLHPMRSSYQKDKIAGTFWWRLSLKEIHPSSCLFVFIRGSSSSPGLCQALCGRDARAPRKSSSHELVIPPGQMRRSTMAPLVVERGPSVFVCIRVHSWFVFIAGAVPGFVRAGRPRSQVGFQASSSFTTWAGSTPVSLASRPWWR